MISRKKQGADGDGDDITDLITDVEGEEQHQHPSGRVTSVVTRPSVVDVFKEGGVEDLHLVGRTEL